MGRGEGLLFFFVEFLTSKHRAPRPSQGREGPKPNHQGHGALSWYRTISFTNEIQIFNPKFSYFRKISELRQRERLWQLSVASALNEVQQIRVTGPVFLLSISFALSAAVLSRTSLYRA